MSSTLGRRHVDKRIHSRQVEGSRVDFGTDALQLPLPHSYRTVPLPANTSRTVACFGAYVSRSTSTSWGENWPFHARRLLRSLFSMSRRPC